LVNNGWVKLNCIKTGGIGSHSKSKYTYDYCSIEILKYKNREELKNNNKVLYDKIHRNKWYELLKHMDSKTKNWTFNEIIEVSSNYRKISHFHKDYSGAYMIAKRNGWLCLIKENMDDFRYWTFETCLEEAKKHSSKKDFRTMSSGAYQASKKKGWYDDIIKILEF
jgi:hypothetical protein